MKRIILLINFLALVVIVSAQNSLGKSDDFARITLAAYVPAQISNMPEAARGALQNKLSQIVTKYGMGGSAMREKFIITANVVVLSKKVTPSAPPQLTYNLEVTFYIGDGETGTKFASTSMEAVGEGTSDREAYMDALTSIKSTNPEFKQFIEQGKNRIIEYYNSKCDFIIKEAQTLATQSKYEEALFKLTSVPEVCKDCFDKCAAAVAPIYKKQIDKDCSSKLSQAKNIWASTQTYDGATNAADILSQIDPNAACFKDVRAFADQIAKRVKELDQREWKFMLKQQQDEVDVTKATIKAARDIGVAYGNNQPKSITTTTSYNIIGWW